MAAEIDVQSLIWALGILAVPVFTAIPLRFIWQYWIGGSHEESEYRTTVRPVSYTHLTLPTILRV